MMAGTLKALCGAGFQTITRGVPNVPKEKNAWRSDVSNDRS